jgi:hypothetical protein
VNHYNLTNVDLDNLFLNKSLHSGSKASTKINASNLIIHGNQMNSNTHQQNNQNNQADF